MVGALVGHDRADVEARGRALLAEFGLDEAGDEWFDERRTRWILGTPPEARAMVERFAAVGVERIMLQDFVPRDLDHIDLLAEALFD
jgi:hypothetical protein